MKFSSGSIKVLRCPFCKEQIYFDRKKLHCRKCKKVFEVKEGISIMGGEDDKEDLIEMKKMVKKLQMIPESKFADISMHFWLPNRPYNLARRLSLEKSFRGFLSRFPRLSKLRILNLACGTGREVEYLLKKGAREIYLVDISFPAVKCARNCFKKFYPRKTSLFYLVADAHFLPFSDKFFDLVLIYASVHHFRNLRPFLKEATRVGKSICLLAEPAKMGIVTGLLTFVGWGTEYGKLKTVRLDEKKLVDAFEKLEMKCKTERLLQYYPKVFDCLGDYPLFVKGWFLFLEILEKVLPRQIRHSLNLYTLV